MDPTPFAERLKAARIRAGLSQQALAEKAGLTAPYVSLLESARRRPPSPAVIQRLATALGAKAEPWLEQAALERSPGTIRKRIEGLDGERRKVLKARDRFLSTALYRLSRLPGFLAGPGDYGAPDASALSHVLGRLAPQLRGVTSARDAKARSEEILAPVAPAERERLLDALPDLLPGGEAVPGAPPVTRAVEVRLTLDPAAPAVELVHVDARWAGPRAWFWRVAGDEGYPRVEAADLLLIDPDRAAADGDLVAVRLAGRDHARVLRRQGEQARLEALRPDVPPLRVALDELAPLGVVVRVVRALA